jgi:hypothetical protein
VHEVESQTQAPLAQCRPVPQLPVWHVPPHSSLAPHALSVQLGVQPQTPVCPPPSHDVVSFVSIDTSPLHAASISAPSARAASEAKLRDDPLTMRNLPKERPRPFATLARVGTSVARLARAPTAALPGPSALVQCNHAVRTGGALHGTKYPRHEIVRGMLTPEGRP